MEHRLKYTMVRQNSKPTFEVIPFDKTQYLMHHGVLGMKWGVRRTAQQLGHKISSGFKYLNSHSKTIVGKAKKTFKTNLEIRKKNKIVKANRKMARKQQKQMVKEQKIQNRLNEAHAKVVRTQQKADLAAYKIQQKQLRRQTFAMNHPHLVNFVDNRIQKHSQKVEREHKIREAIKSGLRQGIQNGIQQGVSNQVSSLINAAVTAHYSTVLKNNNISYGHQVFAKHMARSGNNKKDNKKDD